MPDVRQRGLRPFDHREHRRCQKHGVTCAVIIKVAPKGAGDSTALVGDRQLRRKGGPSPHRV